MSMAEILTEQKAMQAAEIAGYKLGMPLGQGGMGAVYVAEKNGKQYALKILNPDMQPASFAREVAANKKLEHKRIAKIFEHNLECETPYIARQYDPRYSPLNPEKNLPLESIIKIGIGAGEALSYAHSKGVVHGDIKPSNILADHNANILLTDFGLANFQDKIISIASYVQEKEKSSENNLCSIKSILGGTPAYMSPEQKEGKKANEQSDIYSLNAVMFKLLTGKLPGVDAEKLLKQKQAPKEITEILLKGLSSEESRHKTMDDFLKDLKGYQQLQQKTPEQTGTSYAGLAWAVTKGSAIGLTYAARILIGVPAILIGAGFLWMIGTLVDGIADNSEEGSVASMFLDGLPDVLKAVVGIKE